jgi:uncharacterized protein (TIGR02147 family)
VTKVIWVGEKMEKQQTHFDGDLRQIQSDAIDWLRAEYNQRKARNPQYSLRAFAQYLKIPPGPLSEILAKKRKLTPKLGRHLATRLSFSSEEKNSFLKLIQKTRDSQKVISALTAASQEPCPYRQLDADTFALIADWYHYGILSLMETKSFRQDPKWIAERLGISVVEVRTALDRLLRLGLIRQEGELLKPTRNNATSDDVPSTALRKFHRQGLEQAMRALEEVPVTERDITSMTMAVDPSQLPLAKSTLKKLRRHIAELLETGQQTEVYRLSIQLIPITKKEK